MLCGSCAAVYHDRMEQRHPRFPEPSAVRACHNPDSSTVGQQVHQSRESCLQVPPEPRRASKRRDPIIRRICRPPKRRGRRASRGHGPASQPRRIEHTSARAATEPRQDGTQGDLRMASSGGVHCACSRPTSRARAKVRAGSSSDLSGPADARRRGDPFRAWHAPCRTAPCDERCGPRKPGGAARAPCPGASGRPS